MPQEQARIVPLPKELQEALSLASNKVTILQEEEIKLSKSNDKANKEVATKSILVDSLTKKIEDLEKEIVKYESRLEKAQLDADVAEDWLHQVEDATQTRAKELVALDLNVDIAKTTLSSVTVAIRKAEEAENERGALREQVETDHRDRVKSLIETIKNF